MKSFKLQYEPEYTPPQTWEEVAALERPYKIRSAREFLRQAAVRLCDDAGLHPDDIIMLFDAIPEWVSAQRHTFKRRKHDEKVVWRCLKCQHIAADEDWKADMPGGEGRCASCGRTDRVRVEADGKEMHIETGFQGVPLLGVRLTPDDSCFCNGVECPVCHTEGKPAPIKDHRCEQCGTDFCPVCHGIAKAQLSRAFDSCSRCKCKSKSVVGGGG